MAFIEYPNVPDLPGVPKLPRSPQFSPTVQAILGVLEGTLFDLINAPPIWGVYLNGKKVINPTSISAVELKNSANVPTFPVEGGKFANYNKVNNPFTTTVRMIKSGLQIERIEFLNSIDAAVKSLDNYSIVTPEHTYLNCNLTTYDYRRESSNGAYQIVIDLEFTEVRQVNSVYTKNNLVKAPAQPSGAVAKNVGIVQPKKIETKVTQKSLGQIMISTVKGWWDKFANKPKTSLMNVIYNFDVATLSERMTLFKNKKIRFTNFYPLNDRLN